MDFQEQLKFAMAEQILTDAVFENADKEKVKEFMTTVSGYINSLHAPVEVVVAAIYLFHRAHVSQSMKVLDDLTSDKPAIPPWMQ